jgi:hypothetical protein
MPRFLPISLVFLVVGMSSSSCIRNSVVGACNPLQTATGEPIDATCWVLSPLKPMELATIGTFARNNDPGTATDLLGLINVWKLTAPRKESFETEVSKLEIACVTEGGSPFCRWQVVSRPKNPSPRAVFGQMVSEVIETVQGQHPKAVTARIAFWEKDREKGPRLLVVLQNWKIDHVVWTDDRATVSNSSR